MQRKHHGYILISVMIVEERFQAFYENVLSKNFPSNIYIHANVLIRQRSKLSNLDVTKFKLRPQVQLDFSVNTYIPPYYGVTNRMGRIGKIMSYRFGVQFDSIFLMDDDMEILNLDKFVEALNNANRLIYEENLAFIKFTTRPNDDSPLRITPKLGYPWTSNGILLRWMEYQIPKSMMDDWFYHDEWILMRVAIRRFGWRYACYLWSNGLVHHYRECSDKHIEVSRKLAKYLMPELPKSLEVNLDYMNFAGDLYNRLNQFKQ